MKLIDLHMHSSVSLDGEYTPEDLLNLCRQHSIELVSITDHNSVKGLRSLAVNSLTVKELQNTLPKLIPGVELDALINGSNPHILGYGIDIWDERIDAIEDDIRRQKQEGLSYRLNQFKKLGIFVSLADAIQYSRDAVVTGEMLFLAALSHYDNRDNPILKPYRPGGSRSDNPQSNFYWDYCSYGKPLYLPISYQTSAQAIAMIHELNGIAVLAHPAIVIGHNEQLIDRLISEGIDGIEVFSSYHTDADIEFYLSIAKKRKLVVTAGSDFHGVSKPNVKLGVYDCCGMENEIYSSLQRSLSFE